MAVHDFIRNNTHGKLKLVDGAGTELIVPYEMGNVKFGGISRKLNELVRNERRGQHVSTAYGKRKYPTFSFTDMVSNLTSAAAPGTARDFLMQQGPYSGNISTYGAGRVYAVHVELIIEGTAFGHTADETLRGEDFEPGNVDFEEGETADTLSFSGEFTGRFLLNGAVWGEEITDASPL